MDIYMYKFVYTHFLNKSFYHHLFEKMNMKFMLIMTHVYINTFYKTFGKNYILKKNIYNKT